MTSRVPDQTSPTRSSSPSPLHGEWTSVDGYRLFARVGERPGSAHGLPIVLVHGLGVSSRYLEPLANRLAATHPVHAPDLPGHGQSEHPSRVLGVRELSQVLESYLDAAGIDRAAIVANSLGCQIAVDLAARSPERVATLALIGPTGDPALRSVASYTARLVASAPFERPSLVAIVAAEYFEAGPRRVLAEVKAMIADRVADRLPRVQCPCLVIRGERDRIVRQAWAERVATALRAPPPSVISGWGHAVHYSAPSRVEALVRPLLGAATEDRLRPRVLGDRPDLGRGEWGMGRHG